MRKTAFVAILGAGLLAAGCGLVPASQAPSAPKKASPPGKGSPPAVPTPPSPGNQAVATDLANRAVQALGTIGTFTAEARIVDVDPLDGDVYKVNVSVMFKAPARNRFTVLPGSHSNEGLRMMFDDGGDHVIVRPGGILGMARIRLGVDDERVRTSRGFPLMQITQRGILNRLTSPNAALAYLGESSLEGNKADVVALKGPVLLKGVTEERVFLDDRTHLPVRTEMRVGHEIVFAVTVKNLVPNAKLPPDAFDI